MRRVVMICLDGFPVRRVSRDLTPHLLALAESGGAAAGGGRAVLPSSTYVNHATMLTGAGVDAHRVLPGGTPPRPPWERSAQVPTLVDRLAGHGLESHAVVGDQHLVRVLGLERAAAVWPPSPEVPPGVAVDGHGWIVDAETVPRLVEAVRGDASFVFGHLNDPDTAGHDLGPDTDEAGEVYRAADGSVGAVLDALADDWDRTVVIALSDHDMVPRTTAPPVVIEHESIALAVPEGGAAFLWPADGHTPDEAAAAGLASPGVHSVIDVGGLPLALLEPGLIAHWPELPERGYHGGREARATLAVVGGGDPIARELGRRIAAAPPAMADWTPIVLDLLA